MGRHSRRHLKGERASTNSEVISNGDNSKEKALTPDHVRSEKSKSGTKKKFRSFKDLIEAMKPSAEELEYRKNQSKETIDPQEQASLFKCTKCCKNFNENSLKMQTHPCLGVLMCEKCCNYYGSGEFSLDSENEDKYCRWCGEGGTLFGCSKCICGFCKTCIRKHFGKSFLKEVQMDDDWQCFFCNPKPLWKIRHICSIAMEMPQSKEVASSSKAKNGKKGVKNLKSSTVKNINSENMKQVKDNLDHQFSGSGTSSMDLEECIYNNSLLKKNRKNSRKRFYSTSSDESETGLSKKDLKKMRLSNEELKDSLEKDVDFETLKQAVLERLEKVVKLSKYQMAFAMNWSSKRLTKLSKTQQFKTPEDLIDECQKTKWFLSLLSAQLVEFSHSVDLIEESVPKEKGTKESGCAQPEIEPTGFSVVLKFLSFIVSQVNTFVKKGLSLTDVLQAEVYDDNKVIGIKKNEKSSVEIPKESPCNIILPETSSLENKTGTPPNTGTEEPKDDKDESPDEDSFRLVIDQDPEVQEGENEPTDFNSPSNTGKDERKKIQQILEILEHA